ncbi:hypothetical protein PR048_011268 [Dryococelus australis]|uniref:Uncharacterized protein n=1 Tax=Dryococelus australis TaxID=614101 RepID=A0ABQ9HL58_9NEOP|nr:hypothetical protein PR048_011268 [Dryococelus australis]
MYYLSEFKVPLETLKDIRKDDAESQKFIDKIQKWQGGDFKVIKGAGYYLENKGEKNIWLPKKIRPMTTH